MQLARVPTAAGIGGVGGALLSGIFRLLATPVSPPAAPIAHTTVDSASAWSCECICPSLLELVGQLLSSNGPPVSWLVALGLLLAAIFGLICGVLVGLGAAFALGHFRAPRVLPAARDRVAAYRP